MNGNRSASWKKKLLTVGVRVSTATTVAVRQVSLTALLGFDVMQAVYKLFNHKDAVQSPE
jgi:hypothetical protein